MTTLYDLYFPKQKGNQNINFQEEMGSFKDKINELFILFKTKITVPKDNTEADSPSGNSLRYWLSAQGRAGQSRAGKWMQRCNVAGMVGMIKGPALRGQGLQ